MTEESPDVATPVAPVPASAPMPPPAWYPDPATGVQRWWDGTAWAPTAPPPPPAALYPVPVPQPAYRPAAPTEKSSGTASVLTFFFPGAGHLYLGDNQKAMPGLIVNTVGLLLAFSVILLPISVIGWAITLAMTLPHIKQDTERANAEALARYQQR